MRWISPLSDVMLWRLSPGPVLFHDNTTLETIGLQ